MALTQGSSITATDMTALKNKINAELTRRAHTGSVSSYSAAFSTAPSTGTKMTATQIQEIVTPLSKINTVSYSNTTAGSLALALSIVDTQVDNFASKALTASDHGCSASCTGLCSTTCTGSCKGCTSCSGGCSGCSGCSGTCKGSCKGCSGGCTGGCGSKCGGGCYGTCTGSGCKSSCWSVGA